MRKRCFESRPSITGSSTIDNLGHTLLRQGSINEAEQHRILSTPFLVAKNNTVAADPAIGTLFKVATLGDELGAAPPGSAAIDEGLAVDPTGAPVGEVGGAGGEVNGDLEGDELVGVEADGLTVVDGEGVGIATTLGGYKKEDEKVF
ncbi:Hypothetical predicted protein [Olea europaea subsp. europaea]|uniref:Uncharacterized protein n=1 Tax=Olea europaea subsp. europaea TaxID=158383 RepID=A0A8S0UC85_OLEEU|nr:Hypothetical predicted protein [Olea europaea subsp. europaea]